MPCSAYLQAWEAGRRTINHAESHSRDIQYRDADEDSVRMSHEVYHRRILECRKPRYDVTVVVVVLPLKKPDRLDNIENKVMKKH